MTGSGRVARRPVGDGLFLGSLERLDDLRLAGTLCARCATTAFTASALCPNCGASEIATIPLDRNGIVMTFSILRHAPPGDYKGRQPFEPFPVALVSLADGVAVVTPLDVAVEAVHIGMEVSLAPHILFRDGEGRDVIAFRFAARTGGRP